MSDDRVRRLLDEVRTPGPPPDLRARALARADGAWAATSAPDRWRLLWESRPLRLAWAAAVLLLLAGNLAVPDAGSSRHTPLAAANRSDKDPEIEEVVTLHRLRLKHVVDVAGSAQSRPGEVPPLRAVTNKETQS